MVVYSVSSLNSELSGVGSSPAVVTVLCSRARHFTLTVALSTQVYKWVTSVLLGNLAVCWGVTYNGPSNTPNCFILQKPELGTKNYEPVGL